MSETSWTPADIDHTNTVVREVLGERARQRGRYSKAHDDSHPAVEWAALVLEQAGTVATYRRVGPAYRIGLIAVAATAIAAAEAYDRQLQEGEHSA